MTTNILDGILIGGAGGAIAGLMVYFVQYVHDKIKDSSDSKTVYLWLEANSSKEKRYRSTRAIASHTNLTMDRVRYICSCHKKVHLSTGKEEDRWSVYDRVKEVGFFDMY